MERGMDIFCNIVGKRYSPRVIYDIGARDCSESEFLLGQFKESVAFAFEPNKDTICKCYDVAARMGGRLSVFNAAVSSSSGPVFFYRSTTSNAGASSLFVPSGEFDHVEPMPVEKCLVRSVRLDALIDSGACEKPDTMWMDCQGGELGALIGLGRYLDGVRAIWTELLYNKIYKDCPTSDEAVSFLCKRGFEMIYEDRCGNDSSGKSWFGNACFVKA